MKQFKHIFTLILISALLLITVSGCSKTDFALKIGEVEISSKQYKSIAQSYKSQFLTGNGIEETDELWDQYVDDSYTATMQTYLDSSIQSYIIKYNLYAMEFDRLGLELDKEVVSSIENEINSFENQYGGRKAFEKALKEQGYEYDQFVEQFYDEAKEQAIIMYYFGPDSTHNPTSKEDIIAYYNEYYAKVKHIFFSTKDDETNDYSKEEKSKIGQKAEGVYNRIKNGEDFEKLLDEFNEDPGMATSPDGYIFSTEDTSYVQIFKDTAFDMQPGEVRLVQSYMGYHIMKKYPLTEAETQDPANERMLIENMKSSEATELLDQLKEKYGVTYNNTVLKNLSVKNLPRVTESTSESDALKEQITGAIADQQE